MYVQKIEFSFEKQPEELSDLVSGYLATLRMNGQIYGKEWPIFIEENCCASIVLTPEELSLDQKFFDSYVKKNLESLSDSGVIVSTKLISRDLDGESCCNCKKSAGYFIFTTYVRIGSPVICIDCFRSIPLYKLPVMDKGDYSEIIRWESDYQSCDSLQMNCTVLEKSTIRQMSNLNSDLNMDGRNICQQLSEKSGKPVYYYLFRSGGRSLTQERNRLCPSCGSKWLLDNPIYKFLHFKCDKCRLLSNIAWGFY